ncbi:MAG: CRISPR-associated protein Cas4 [Acutalibacteraceae bacterium]
MDEMKVTGMDIYYYYVCQKKLWYFSHEISMESESENVKLGKVLDETTYTNQKKHIMIDDTINIDYLSEHNILHEVKKSRKIEEAGIWQLKYYIYYLQSRGIEGLRGRIDYPLLKQSLWVDLTEEDIVELEKTLAHIKDIKQSEIPPYREGKKFCKSCAYYDFCYI